MDLRRLLAIARSRLPLLVAGIVLGGGIATVASSLQPRTYEAKTTLIVGQSLSGVANFEPGVYVIRGKDPVTQISLAMVAGTVNAQGVMFYITDSAAYDGVSGDPDQGDGDRQYRIKSSDEPHERVVKESQLNRDI